MFVSLVYVYPVTVYPRPFCLVAIFKVESKELELELDRLFLIVRLHKKKIG